MKLKYLTDAWLILVLALCFGTGLAAVHISLDPKIKANKKDETNRRIPGLLGITTAEDKVMGVKVEEEGDVSHMTITLDGGEPIQIDAVRLKMDGDFPVKVTRDGKPVGWVIKAAGSGYADTIELLVGLNVDISKITGMAVLSQKETPALGEKIKEDFFTRQFSDLDTNQSLNVIKKGGQIKALTAATVSSVSVCKIINQAMSQWKPVLIEKGKSQ